MIKNTRERNSLWCCGHDWEKSAQAVADYEKHVGRCKAFHTIPVRRETNLIVEIIAFSWDRPTMTVTTDDKKRVVIPSAQPGDRFDVRVTTDGKVVLTRLEMADKPDNVRLLRKHGYTVARGTRPITDAQVRRAMDEFP